MCVVCCVGIDFVFIGVDVEYDDYFVVDCCVSAGVGVFVYEVVYLFIVSGVGCGVWLVDFNGFCCCEWVGVIELLVNVFC